MMATDNERYPFPITLLIYFMSYSIHIVCYIAKSQMISEGSETNRRIFPADLTDAGDWRRLSVFIRSIRRIRWELIWPLHSLQFLYYLCRYFTLSLASGVSRL